MIKGFKVFNENWTCKGKQYSCPGRFKEDVMPKLCWRGMHFCKKLEDCFIYYAFRGNIKVAEVIAHGKCVVGPNKICTNDLEIVREIPWDEVLEIVNIGIWCKGFKNTGDKNEGDYNTGDNNQGDYNTGICNAGSYNAGDMNKGRYNTGSYNEGGCNTGSYNIGYCNTGNFNTGDYNTGSHNRGKYNTGDFNLGFRSAGCFNTVEQPLYLFDKPSTWTWQDWYSSRACNVLLDIPMDADAAQRWWGELAFNEQEAIQSIPNFDAEIFKKITGIDIYK